MRTAKVGKTPEKDQKNIVLGSDSYNWDESKIGPYIYVEKDYNRMNSLT